MSNPIIIELLDKLLLKRLVRLDRFDATYLEDFHHILRENYGISKIADHAKNANFTALLSELKIPEDSIMRLSEITGQLQQIPLDKNRYSPKIASEQDKALFKYTLSKSWNDTKNLKVDSNNINKITNLQVEYSFDVSHGRMHHVSSESFWNRSPTLDIFKNELFRNMGPENRVLSIGPRWEAEIEFIRHQFNLPLTIGLDLYSRNLDLVKVGDMHRMPFEDNSFDVVYQKNTFNKAYDLRQALNECVRVLKNGGILISDECLDYTSGVDELARSNVTDNAWFQLYLQDYISEILVSQSESANDTWLNKVGLFAVKIKK